MATGEYFGWTVQRLKVELAKRGAVVNGRKEVLINRLQAYDRNKNFKEEPVILPPVQLPQWPAAAEFRQLTEDKKEEIPKLSLDQINYYFKEKMAVDNNKTGDAQALVKGKLLLESARILACSIAKEINNCYFMGIVAAAMKKKVSYNYKLCLDSQSGDILNSDCDCPAGKGPHCTCKHVAAVLLLLNLFAESGSLTVEKSCTEILQTFHTPRRRYQGSPVKADKLLVNKKACSLEDPRPLKFRQHPAYNDNVRNAVLNYCANYNSDLAVRYLYPKANIQEAQTDHDYLKEPFLVYWVDQQNQVTEEEAALIESKTKLQSNSHLWHSERKWRLTASKFAEVCKRTEKRNIEKLCTSIVCPQELKGNAVNHGLKYEQVAVSKLEKLENVTVVKSGLHICVDKLFLAASPGGLIGKDFILEVKCPYNGRNETVNPGEHFAFLNEEKQLSKTHKYYYQVQGQLYVCQRKACYFVVYTFCDIFIQKVEYDQEFCTQMVKN